MNIQPLKRFTLPDEIVDQIKKIIFNEELKPGDKIPSERELAVQFSVGRTTIREALKALNAMGLIIRTKEGTVVNSDITSLFTDPLTQMLILKKINYQELIEARKALEVEIAGLAAERANMDDIDMIEQTLREMSIGVDSDLDKFVKADMAFHEVVAEAAQNKVLYELFTAVRHLLFEVQKIVVMSVGIRQRSLDYHTKIFEAIREQNSTKCRNIMMDHLVDVEKSLLQITNIK